MGSGRVKLFIWFLLMESVVNLMSFILKGFCDILSWR